MFALCLSAESDLMTNFILDPRSVMMSSSMGSNRRSKQQVLKSRPPMHGRCMSSLAYLSRRGDVSLLYKPKWLDYRSIYENNLVLKMDIAFAMRRETNRELTTVSCIDVTTVPLWVSPKGRKLMPRRRPSGCPMVLGAHMPSSSRSARTLSRPWLAQLRRASAPELSSQPQGAIERHHATRVQHIRTHSRRGSR